jgi:hypothetical protein
LGITGFFGDGTVTTSTAPTNYTELEDFQSAAANNQTMSVNYRNPVPVGANSATNTWAVSQGSNVGIGFGIAESPAVTSPVRRSPFGL